MDIVAASHMGKILEVIEDERKGDVFSIHRNMDNTWQAMIDDWAGERVIATGDTYMEAIANLDKMVCKT